MILGFTAKLVEDILKDYANNIWDKIWEEIFKAIIEAEKKWDKATEKIDRKKYVKKWVLDYIEKQTNANLGWIEKMIMQVFVGQAVDTIIKNVNEKMGNDWLKQAKKAEQNLDIKIT